MRWTKWILIANKKRYFTQYLSYKGAATYEIGIRYPKGKKVNPVYVGETSNERKRIHAYAQHGSHLSKIIDRHVDRGFTIHYRAIAMTSKQKAKALQDRLLKNFDYDWNLQNNLNFF
jgi:hypothetical protein